MLIDLTSGAIYQRTELHERVGGQRQGGISTPADYPAVLIFTGYAGGQHGYEDGWSNGVFCYFGEGQQATWGGCVATSLFAITLLRGRTCCFLRCSGPPEAMFVFLGRSLVQAGNIDKRRIGTARYEGRSSFISCRCPRNLESPGNSFRRLPVSLTCEPQRSLPRQRSQQKTQARPSKPTWSGAAPYELTLSRARSGPVSAASGRRHSRHAMVFRSWKCTILGSCRMVDRIISTPWLQSVPTAIARCILGGMARH
jgi:hypothetical protein